jgi:glycosyltransferase involved in cell wall biosynthesis
LTQSLVIVQSYIPQYRVPFFTALVKNLEVHGISCTVAAGNPRAAQAARGDAAGQERWRVFAQTRSIRIAGRGIVLGGTYATWRHADAVILGVRGSSLDVYRALLASRARVGLWGHIRSYTGPPSRVDMALERYQLRRADHVFAYTKGGYEAARTAGVPSEKVTAVMNSVETESILDQYLSLSDAEIADYLGEAHSPEAKYVAYIGGLDSTKRVDFLAEALDELWAIEPNCRVLVGGSGPDEILLQSAVARGQVRMLGFVGAREKAIVGRVASAILSPGRIGLLAVEALALRIPIVTTEWPYHAPEAEYLVEGVSRFTSANDPRHFAATVSLVTSLETASKDADYPSLTSMVENFERGVRQMMQR